MNRDVIEPGRTKGKFAESFALWGGIGALLYPLVFWYIGYAAILERDDFFYCQATVIETSLLAKEEVTDWVRFTMAWNCVMIAIYLVLHFALFARPESTSSFHRVGVIFPIVLLLEIIFAVINFILIGVSTCNSGGFATSAILSSLAIIIINGGVLAGSLVTFFAKTKTNTGQVVQQPEENQSLNQPDVTPSEVNASSNANVAAKINEIEEV